MTTEKEPLPQINEKSGDIDLERLIELLAVQNAQQQEPVTGLTNLLKSPAAPVRMPSIEQMEVRLVTRQSLQRLYDASSDAAWLNSLLFLFIGSGLGFVTTMLTAPSFTLDAQKVAYCILDLCAVVFFALLLRRFRKRMQTVRTEIDKES